jgi:hypothetical protein
VCFKVVLGGRGFGGSWGRWGRGMGAEERSGVCSGTKRRSAGGSTGVHKGARGRGGSQQCLGTDWGEG